MNNKEIYLDELSFISSFILFRKFKKYKIFILDDITSKKSKVLFLILRKLRINLEIIDFFAGHMQTSNGETVTNASVREASYASVDCINESNYTNLLSKFLPSDYDFKVLDIYLSKLIYEDLYFIFLRSMIVKSLGTTTNPVLIIKKPKKINKLDLKKKYNLVDIQFYQVFDFFPFIIFKTVCYYYISQTIKTFLYYLRKKKISTDNIDLPGILTFQSNTLREDLSFRGEPNWIDRSNNSPTYNTFIISKTTSFFKSGYKMSVSNDFDKLDRNNVISIPIYSVSQVPNLTFLFKFFLKCFEYRKQIKNNIKYYLLDLLLLYYDSLNYENFLTKYNIKLVYFHESQSLESICLITQKNNIKTLAQQYSNLPFFSVIMTAKVDMFLLSSNIYKKCFHSEGVGPNSFKSTGYSYSYVQKYVSNRSKFHRLRLEKMGVDFIICYFDERVDLNNKWGTVDNHSHLNDLKKLIGFMLNNENIGLVIKSQFMKYSPSNWYPNEAIFKEAINTNRYIELNEGNQINRNDILPTEAALISDICISQKFGATAALESAILNRRTLLIDKYPIKTEFDYLYSKSQIVFGSMQESINVINEFLKGNSYYRNLGDWSSIINEFNEFQDLDNLKRVRETIEELILNKI